MGQQELGAGLVNETTQPGPQENHFRDLGDLSPTTSQTLDDQGLW